MSDAVGPGDLVLRVNAAPNHVTGTPAPLVAGETYRVFDMMPFRLSLRALRRPAGHRH